MDLDYALHEDEPLAPTDTDAPEGAVSEVTRTKDFLKAIKEQFGKSDKALASTLMKRLTSKTFDSSKSVRAHITEMRDLAAQLKTLKIDISESFLVHFILNSLPVEYLPVEYGPFKISYNTHKEEWSISELLTMCVQEEEMMKHDKPEVAHLTTRPKGKGKKDHGKRQYKVPPKIDGSKVKCFFYRNDGHRYFISFIDDYSRYMYLYLLNEKAEALDAFKSFKAEVEKQKDKKIKIVRSDRSGEYYGRYIENGQMNGPFVKFLESEGSITLHTVPELSNRIMQGFLRMLNLVGVMVLELLNLKKLEKVFRYLQYL
ncbi:hypothetical protein CRG98_022229 [Punica granatum]|uniref:Integrase catalytic domain-containing protein n=1 Tax=Punica granatum TaxID=22663 RepID=A0A2I0JM72_PUNGR|nr:hypothetical protein CRG98_022229 [Punica granatum]